jgi:hypothetical protein
MHITLSNWNSFMSWNNQILWFLWMQITKWSCFFIKQSFERDLWVLWVHITLSNWNSFISWEDWKHWYCWRQWFSWMQIIKWSCFFIKQSFERNL